MIAQGILILAIAASIIATPFGAVVAFTVGMIALALGITAVAVLINVATFLRRQARG